MSATIRARWRSLTLVVLLAALSVLGSAPACDTVDTSPSVVVQKWDAVHSCFGTIPIGDSTPIDGFDAGVCPAASAALNGGTDQLRIVIGYGNLKFNSSTAPPTPTVSMTLDGVATSPNASTSLAQAASPTIFYATFAAPARAVQVMDLSVSVTQGFAHDPVGPLTVNAPAATVSLPGCAANDAGGCEEFAGEGSAIVSVVAPGTSATAGVLTWSLNGVLQSGSVPVNLLPEPNTDNALSGLAMVPVPTAPDRTSWTLIAQVGAASGSTSAIISAPGIEVEAQVAGCSPGAGICPTTADVGTLPVVVTMRGDATTGGSITSSLAGVLQPTTFPITLSPMANQAHMLQGVAFVPVPSAPANTMWTLTAQVGSVSNSTTVSLQAPVIGALLAHCTTASCPVTVGEMALLTITAPLSIETQQAVVSTTVDGTASAGPLTVNLTTSDIANGLVSGAVGIPVPNQSGAAWTINVNVGGYNAPTVIATIQ